MKFYNVLRNFLHFWKEKFIKYCTVNYVYLYKVWLLLKEHTISYKNISVIHFSEIAEEVNHADQSSRWNRAVSLPVSIYWEGGHHPLPGLPTLLLLRGQRKSYPKYPNGPRQPKHGRWGTHVPRQPQSRGFIWGQIQVTEWHG